MEKHATFPLREVETQRAQIQGSQFIPLAVTSLERSAGESSLGTEFTMAFEEGPMKISSRPLSKQERRISKILSKEFRLKPTQLEMTRLETDLSKTRFFVGGKLTTHPKYEKASSSGLKLDPYRDYNTEKFQGVRGIIIRFT